MTQSIVLTVCAEYLVSPADFFSHRTDRRFVRCRVEAIRRLRAAGFSQAAIARLVKREYSTVRYWLHPKYRERRKVRQLAAYHASVGQDEQATARAA
jgi:hypothetical protein